MTFSFQSLVFGCPFFHIPPTPKTLTIVTNVFCTKYMVIHCLGRLEVGKVQGSCRLPRDGPDYHTWQGSTHVPPYLLIIGWESPRSALPMD
jgi:hypothetical protein